MVDVENQTVNGRPAEITDEKISWRTTLGSIESITSINRFTGEFMHSSTNWAAHPFLSEGTCRKVDRKF